jgi:hypothetical protein
MIRRGPLKRDAFMQPWLQVLQAILVRLEHLAENIGSVRVFSIEPQRQRSRPRSGFRRTQVRCDNSRGLCSTNSEVYLRRFANVQGCRPNFLLDEH